MSRADDSVVDSREGVAGDQRCDGVDGGVSVVDGYGGF